MIAVAAILAGCGSDSPKQVHVRGQLALAGNGKLPNEASARISLVEQATGGGKNRIVAERTLHDLGKLPVRFDLQIGSQLLGSGGQYGLSAQIMDSHGHVRWQTPVPQTVSPRQQNQPVLLMLQANETGMAGDFRHYRCGDDFHFDMASNQKQAVVHLGKRQISLVAKKNSSAQTGIYADDHGDQLTLGHNKITLTVDGATHMNCMPQGETSTAGQDTGHGSGKGQGSAAGSTRSDNGMSSLPTQ